MKKFPYLTISPFENPIFTYKPEPCKFFGIGLFKPKSFGILAASYVVFSVRRLFTETMTSLAAK